MHAFVWALHQHRSISRRERKIEKMWTPIEYCGDYNEPAGCVVQYSKHRQRSCARNSANLDHQLLYGQKNHSKTHKITKRKSRGHENNSNSKKELRILTKQVARALTHRISQTLRSVSGIANKRMISFDISMKIMNKKT